MHSDKKHKSSPISIKVTKPTKWVTYTRMNPQQWTSLTVGSTRTVIDQVKDEIPLGRPESKPKVRYLAAALSSEEKHARVAPQWTAGKIYDRLCADTHLAVANVKCHVWGGGSHAPPSQKPMQSGDRRLSVKDKSVISIKKGEAHEDTLSTDGSFSSQPPSATSDRKKSFHTISIELPGYESYDADDDDHIKRKKAERCCRGCGSPVPEHVCQFQLDL